MTTATPPIRVFYSDLSARDQAAVDRHLEYLRAEPCARSLNAILPESHIAVTVSKSGEITTPA